jgi:mRNA interferase MazF
MYGQKQTFKILQMKRGEIWWVSFDPSIGSEMKKTRPAVIVSNNVANQVLSRIQVVPISSQMEKMYPCEARITIHNKSHKAMADQIGTVSKKRLTNKLGKVTALEMEAVEQAIQFQLGIR